MKKIITIIIILISGIGVVQAQIKSSAAHLPQENKDSVGRLLHYRGAGELSDSRIQNSTANTITRYLETSAQNNPGLQAKYMEFEAALEKIAQVSALPDPSFSFGYFLSPVETRVGPQRAKFSLSQMFPWFGTLEAKGDAAALLAQSKYQSFLDARNKLYYQVAAAYYPLYELQQLKEIEQENIEILQSYKTISTRKFEHGAAPMVDALRVEIMLQDSKTNLEILNKKERALISTFNNLLNRNEELDVVVSDTLPIGFEIRNLKDSLLAGNPALEALELKTRVSKMNEVVAQKQGLPNIGVGLDYVVVGEPSGMSVADAGKDVLMPMVSVSIPIFRKKYKAAEKEAQLMQESYILQKADVLNMLSSEFDQTLFEIQQQQDLLELYQKQIVTTQQSLNLLFSSYSNSNKDFEEVLRMQQMLLQYEKLMAKAIAQYHTSVAQFDYITAKNIYNEQ